MSLEKFRPGDSRARIRGVKAEESSEQTVSRCSPSGGVSVDSTPGSEVTLNWENSGEGNKPQAGAQAGQTSEASGVAGEVGVPNTSVDLHYFKRCKEQRGDTYSTQRGEAKDTEMAGTTRIVTPNKVRELQIVLYRKAKAQPKYRFWSLYGDLLRQDVLNAALETQVRNGGAPGVDGETVESINAAPEKRQQWLGQLREELKAKSYRPSPVRRVMIPKSSGGERPLGIPTVKDRVVQSAVCMLLMPIWEADFHPHSYGFRPKRRAHQAVDAVVQGVYQGYTELIDADLTKYFETIPHRDLMRMVAKRVSDGSILRLIKSWLRAPVIEEDKDGTRRVIPNRRGTPQGGVISPLLANLYLNPLDHGVNQQCMGKARMVRYADDFVIVCRRGQAREVLKRTKKWLSAKGLALNESKTRVVDIRHTGINFLGFNLTWRRSLKGRPYLHVEPSQKSRAALRESLRGVLSHWTTWKSVASVVKETNRVLRGWAGYFHYRNSTSVLNGLKWYSRERLRRWLWRKHACTRGLWNYPDEHLHTRYGLYALPTHAAWKVFR